MKTSLTGLRILFVALAILTLASQTAWAQESATRIRTYGNGSGIDVNITMRIGDNVPEEWVGWIVTRSVVGNCDYSGEPICGVRPFVSGESEAQMTDENVVATATYRYNLSAVDAAGNRLNIAYAFDNPGFVNIDFASVNEDAPFAEGRLVSDGAGGVQVAMCDDNCWPGFWVPFYPEPDLADLVGTQTLVRLYGHLGIEFEGPYVVDITHWETTGTCSPVSSDETSWDRLKAMYR